MPQNRRQEAQNVRRGHNPAAARPAPSSPARHRGPAAQSPQGRRSNVQRPSAPGRAPQRRMASPSQARRPAQTPQKNRQREWIYPEGYRPEQNAKRPAPRPPQKKQKPKQSYKWVGVLIRGVALRLLIGMVIGLSVLGIVYNNKFYSNVEEAELEAKSYYYYDDDEKFTLKEADAFHAHNDGELMISYSDISAWLDMAQVGDIYTMRFVISNGDGISESVVFHNSSHNAFVNGEIIVMDARTRFENGEVWVPVSFVTEYMTGFSITEKGNTLKLEKNEDKLSFVLGASEPIANLEYPEDDE